MEFFFMENFADICDSAPIHHPVYCNNPANYYRGPVPLQVFLSVEVQHLQNVQEELKLVFAHVIGGEQGFETGGNRAVPLCRV